MVFYQKLHSNYPSSYNYTYCKLLHGPRNEYVKLLRNINKKKYGSLEFSVLSCTCNLILNQCSLDFDSKKNMMFVLFAELSYDKY